MTVRIEVRGVAKDILTKTEKTYSIVVHEDKMATALAELDGAITAIKKL